MRNEPALRLASGAQQASRDRSTASVWGGGLTVDGFLEREQVLRGHPWARGAMRGWWWCPEGAEAPLASCETFSMPGQVGETRGTSLLIASVFTDPELRGQGHASAMLRALTEQARREGAQALVLFSEIGTGLYSSLGFVAAPSFDVLLPGRRSERPRLAPCNRSARSFVPGEGALSLERTAGQLAWQLERERFYAQALGRPLPTQSSASLGESSIGWTAYYKTNELQVLWLEADGDSRAALLEAAQHTAWELGLERVRVWDTGRGEWASQVPGAVVLSRDDEVPMFLPLTNFSRWHPIERGHWA